MDNLAAHADAMPCGLRHCGRIAFAGNDAQKHGSLEALHLGNVGSAMVARWPVSKAVRGRHMTLRLPGDLVVPLKVRLCALRSCLSMWVLPRLAPICKEFANGLHGLVAGAPGRRAGALLPGCLAPCCLHGRAWAWSYFATDLSWRLPYDFVLPLKMRSSVLLEGACSEQRYAHELGFDDGIVFVLWSDDALFLSSSCMAAVCHFWLCALVCCNELSTVLSCVARNRPGNGAQPREIHKSVSMMLCFS